MWFVYVSRTSVTPSVVVVGGWRWGRGDLRFRGNVLVFSYNPIVECDVNAEQSYYNLYDCLLRMDGLYFVLLKCKLDVYGFLQIMTRNKSLCQSCIYIDCDLGCLVEDEY